MIKFIEKYPIIIDKEFQLDLPLGSEVLGLSLIIGCPFVWVLLSKEFLEEKRFFELFKTGEAIECGIGFERKYIGTFVFKQEVNHLFERLIPKQL